MGRRPSILPALALLAWLGGAGGVHAQVFYGICPTPAPVMDGGRLTVFSQDADAKLTHLYYDNAWKGWLGLLEGVTFWNPAAIAVPPSIATKQRLQVFSISPDSHLMRTAYDEGTLDWSPWQEIGAKRMLGGSPSAVVAGNRLVVFALTDASLPTHIFQDAGGKWSEWHDLPLEGLVASVSAVMAGDRLTIFAPTGPRGELLHAFYDSAQSAWTPWIEIEHAADAEGYYVMGPASAVMHGDRLTVFATDTTRGRVVSKHFDPSARKWTAWSALTAGEHIVSAPGAVVAGNRLVVFAANRFGTLVHQFLEGGKWSSWVPLASGVGGCVFAGVGE